MSHRVLVTGGAGFIGSHLCERLLELGDEVICLDNFFTGRKQNIAHLLDNPGFELIRHDITFPIFVEDDDCDNVQMRAQVVAVHHIMLVPPRPGGLLWLTSPAPCVNAGGI